ncbi:MAG: Gfo/Idh/MocA family protein [Bacteroidota bacterium]
MSDKIRFAIIGHGHIGKRHAEMVRRDPDAHLVAVCDIADQDVSGLDVPFFNSAEALFQSGLAFDVVNVCTPNGLHAHHAMMAIQAGKHVVVEKPMALSKAACEELIHAGLAKGVNIFCVMQNRYSPPAKWLKEIVSNGTLGDVYMVQLNCYWNRDDRYYKKGGWKGTADMDGGTLFTQFSHFIDIMYWVFGDITDIQGKFADFCHQQSTDFEDSGMVNFRFLKGGLGCINYSTAVWDCNMESSITITGSKGSLKIGGQYMNEVEYCHIKDYVMPQLEESSPANDYGAYKGSASNHHFIIRNVIETLQGRTTITTNALEGLKVVEIIESIYDLRNRSQSIK